MMNKHDSIHAELKRRILGGEYRGGERLPTEQELCVEFAASRITVARAVKDLERDGLARRQAGSGSFVVAPDERAERPFHLLVPYSSGKYYSDMCRAFQDGFIKHGVYAAVVATDYDTPYTAKLLKWIAATGTNGLAVVPSSEQVAEADYLRLLQEPRDFPVVVGSRELPGFRGEQVVVDEEQSGHAAATHLLAQGRERLAFLGPWTLNGAPSPRYRGFRRAYPDAETFPRFEELDALALRGLRSLFESPVRPDAVVAPSEIHALQAYDLLVSLGVSIPADVALVGLDGGTLAPSAELPLTTLDFPGAKIGAELAETLWSLHQNGVSKPGRVRRIPSDLVVRASCGARPAQYRHEYLRGLLDERG